VTGSTSTRLSVRSGMVVSAGVYLAKDLNLDGDLVALKGLINENDPQTAEAAVNEKKYLIALRHENIVRILDFVVHQDVHSAKTDRLHRDGVRRR